MPVVGNVLVRMVEMIYMDEKKKIQRNLRWETVYI